MKTNKIVLLGATFLAALTLAACSNSSAKGSGSGDLAPTTKEVAKKGFPIVDKPLKMTMFAPGSGESEYKNMAALKEYAKMTNVDFTYTTPPAADLSTKLNLALASGDAPDVLFAAQITNAQAIQYGGSTLIPLEKYIDEGYMPNLKKILDKFPDVRKSITTPDGHIYTLPFLGNQYVMDDAEFAKQPQLYQGTLWYNGDWLKKLNLQVPKTTDEMYNVLKAFRDQDPNGNGKKDEIPLSVSSSDSNKLASLRPTMMNAFGVLSQEQYVNPETGKVVYGAVTDGYRDYLAFMNKLYAEKLLDNQTFSQSDDQKKAKAADGMLGSYTDWFSYFTSGKTPEQATQDPMAYPMTSEQSPKAVFNTTDGVTNGAFAITKKAENPAAALRWVDYFYTTEGAQFLNAGPDQSKGGYWHEETNDKGEKVKVLNDGVKPEAAEDARAKVSPDYGTIPPKANSRPVLILPEKNAPLAKDAFSQWLDKEVAQKESADVKVVGWPQLYMSKEQQNQLGSTMQTDLLTYVQQMEAKFITGQEKLTDASWKKYVETLKGIGVDKYTQIQQDAYSSWKKAK